MVILGTTSVIINNWKVRNFSYSSLQSLFRADKKYRLIRTQVISAYERDQHSMLGSNVCKMGLKSMVKQFPYLRDHRMNESINSRINQSWMKHQMIDIQHKCKSFPQDCNMSLSHIAHSLHLYDFYGAMGQASLQQTTLLNVLAQVAKAQTACVIDVAAKAQANYAKT